MEQIAGNDLDEVADEDNGERLYANAEAPDDAHEDFITVSDVFYLEEKEEEEKPRDDLYLMEEEELPMPEYEVEPYEEPSVIEEIPEEEIPEERDIPAEIYPVEKLEEEVPEAVMPDRALVEIPVEISASRELMIKMLRECQVEQMELRRKNKYLEAWIVKYMKKMQEEEPTVVVTEPEEMEQLYKETLYTYKLRLDNIMEEKARTTSDLQAYESKVQMMRDESARAFDGLLKREREVAIGLIYAKTGRKLTEKTVNELIHRQVSRHEILIRNRYEHLILQHRFDDLSARAREMETLGEGMTSLDYEALHVAQINYRDKLDERDRELEKLRYKIAQVVNGIAHYKEKEASLGRDIKLEQEELEKRSKRVVKARRNINQLHFVLRDLRHDHDEKRHDAGLLAAQPMLREMEATMNLLEALKKDIEIMKEQTQREDRAARMKTRSRGEASASHRRDDDDDDAELSELCLG